TDECIAAWIQFREEWIQFREEGIQFREEGNEEIAGADLRTAGRRMGSARGCGDVAGAVGG
ncbi:MAG: hypothetical protein ABI134_14030, partial [Byssovorax sp.]